MKHDYQNILYCRIRLKELILPKSNSAFLKLRKSCKYCARPHPCEKYNYCPFDGQLEEDIEPKYSMKKAIEELKKYGITDVSQSLLKHYNNLGLINPRKTSKGHRRFSEYDLRGIVFIKLLTGINFKFKLDEIRYYLRVVMNKDIDVVEKIFGNIGFSNDDFLVDKRIDNYSRKGDQSLYWWTDSSQGQELLQKAETRMIQRTVWGYVYKNLEYDKDADILKYKMYLYPEKAEAHEAKIKRFLEFMHLYILFLCGRVDLYKIKDTLGAIDKFSLWVDDRYTGFNKIVKARIHIYTILRPIDLEINADKSRVTLNYTFEVKDDEKEKYSDYYLEDNYHSERDGMYRIYL